MGSSFTVCCKSCQTEQTLVHVYSAYKEACEPIIQTICLVLFGSILRGSGGCVFCHVLWMLSQDSITLRSAFLDENLLSVPAKRPSTEKYFICAWVLRLSRDFCKNYLNYFGCFKLIIKQLLQNSMLYIKFVLVYFIKKIKKFKKNIKKKKNYKKIFFGTKK